VISNRQAALDAAVTVWERRFESYGPGRDGERILQLATEFETWLDRPGPAASLSITAGPLRRISALPLEDSNG
jgi:hypothetical protein